MKNISLIIFVLMLNGIGFTTELNDTRWLVHNKKVEVLFKKSEGKYHAVAVKVATDFDKVSVGDTIVRNIVFTIKDNSLNSGNIKLGRMSARFSGRIENDTILSVDIGKLFIKKQQKWKRVQ
ncbi:MAG: hypothetical protein JNL74_22240 [Fibrobacteres bacterium]|nr:hypothetical protein [Fibrobacterota bacterium]